MNNAIADHHATLSCQALSRASFAAAFAVRRRRQAPDAVGARRRDYDPLDTVREAERSLTLAYDGPVPAGERQAAARRVAARRALLAEPRGLPAALAADIARLDADIARHRRYLRADVARFRRALESGDGTWFPRLAISHDKRMLRLLAAKRRDAEAMRAGITAGLADER